LNESIGKLMFVFLQLFRNIIGFVLFLMIPIPLILRVLSKKEEFSYYDIKMKKYLEHTTRLFEHKTKSIEAETEMLIQKNEEPLERENFDLNFSQMIVEALKMKIGGLKEKISNFSI
jgi:putative Mn2+ efflux pump MntP